MKRSRKVPLSPKSSIGKSSSQNLPLLEVDVEPNDVLTTSKAAVVVSPFHVGTMNVMADLHKNIDQAYWTVGGAVPSPPPPPPPQQQQQQQQQQPSLSLFDPEPLPVDQFRAHHSIIKHHAPFSSMNLPKKHFDEIEKSTIRLEHVNYYLAKNQQRSTSSSLCAAHDMPLVMNMTIADSTETSTSRILLGSLPSISMHNGGHHQQHYRHFEDYADESIGTIDADETLDAFLGNNLECDPLLMAPLSI